MGEETENISAISYDFWADLEADMRYQWRIKMQEKDVFLGDYLRVCQGTMRDETGVIDAPVPQSRGDEYMAIGENSNNKRLRSMCGRLKTAS